MKLDLVWNVVGMVALLLLFTTSSTTCVYGYEHDSNPDKTQNRPPSSPAPRITASPSAFIAITPPPVFKTPIPRRAPTTTKPRGSTLPPTQSPFLPSPSQQPTPLPTSSPSKQATRPPTSFPTKQPTQLTTLSPTGLPTSLPTSSHTQSPTISPTQPPTLPPTQLPTVSPTPLPTLPPTGLPTSPPTATPRECFASSCSNPFMGTVSSAQTSINQPVHASCLRNSPAVLVNTCNLGRVQANFFLVSFVENCRASALASNFNGHLYVLEVPDTKDQCPGTVCAMLTPGFQQGSNPLSFPATAGAKYSIIAEPDNVVTITTYNLIVACL